jgi:hypothetical protein
VVIVAARAIERAVLFVFVTPIGHRGGGHSRSAMILTASFEKVKVEEGKL